MGAWSVRGRLSTIATLLLAVPLAGIGQQARPGDEPPALVKLRTYLDTYEAQISELIADELFDQRFLRGVDSERRLLVSEVGFLRLPGNLEWIGQRRVLSVDGRAVRTTSGPLAEEFAKRSDIARALTIAGENAKFNLGKPRSINVPTLPLDLLSRRSAAALVVVGTGVRRLDKQPAATISLREPGPGTLVASGPDRFAQVTIHATVHPATGALLTARVDLRLAEENATHRIEVDFGPHASLGLLVPTELRETFLSVRGTATYSNFRRFRTSARIVP